MAGFADDTEWFDPMCSCGETLKKCQEGTPLQHVQRREAHERVSQKSDPRWRQNEHGELLFEAKNCIVALQPRPHYCDRGTVVAFVETRLGTKPQELWIDGQDGFPRYYFDVERGKLEMEAWLKKRKQWVEL